MEEKELNPETMAENTTQNKGSEGEPVAAAPVLELTEIDQIKAEIAEQKDKYLRLMAEFENFKRRTAKERIELIQTAGKDIIVSLLDILDDCDRAEKQLTTTDDIAIQKEGIQFESSKLEALSRRKEFNDEFNNLKRTIKDSPLDEENKAQLLDNLWKTKDFYYQANDFNGIVESAISITQVCSVRQKLRSSNEHSSTRRN